MNAPQSSPNIPHIEHRNTNVLHSISDSLLGIIPPLEKDNLKHQTTEIQSLIENLKLCVEREINRTRYTYGDYKERLCICEDQVLKKLPSILGNHPEIKIIYFMILNTFLTHSTAQTIKNRLWEDTLRELVLILMSEKSFTPVYKVGGVDRRIASILDVLKKKNSLVALDLSTHTLQNATMEEIQTFALLFTPLRSLDLGNTQINHLGHTQADTLFQNLSNLKYLGLSSNSLFKSPDIMFARIFEKLPQVKGLSLENNALGTLSPARLSHVFQPLSGLKLLSLNRNYLGGASNQVLESIFSHLPNLKSLHLGGNQFGTLDDDQIHSIFGHLPNLQNLTLTEKCLYRERLRTLYPNLIGKIIYREYE